MTDDIQQRYLRQQDWVPLDNCPPCTVIGVGATGRQTSLVLASMGVPQLTLIDFDEVERHNCAVQMYPESSIGQSKAAYTAAECQELNPHIDIESLCIKFDKSASNLLDGQAVFCCADNMNCRYDIALSLRQGDGWRLFDQRMLGETLHICTATPDNLDAYQDTLFPSSEAEPGRCTGRTTLHAAYVSAGLAVGMLARSIRGAPIPQQVRVALPFDYLNAVGGIEHEEPAIVGGAFA